MSAHPCPKDGAQTRAETFLDVLADRALREDPDVLGTILTVGSGAAAVDADSAALTARILERGHR